MICSVNDHKKYPKIKYFEKNSTPENWVNEASMLMWEAHCGARTQKLKLIRALMCKGGKGTFPPLETGKF